MDNRYAALHRLRKEIESRLWHYYLGYYIGTVASRRSSALCPFLQTVVGIRQRKILVSVMKTEQEGVR